MAFHPVYLRQFLKDLGLSRAIPRTKCPSRPENAEEMLDEPHNKRDGDDEDGWVVDDDICTDGGTVLGFFDASHPQSWDNSQRLYYVDDPHITRPLVRHDKPTVGFYALNGESAEEFRALVTDLFDRLTNRLRFANSWIDEFLNDRLHKLS